MSTQEFVKPPPQVMGVTGIEAKPLVMNEPEGDINWGRATAFPPFQMFAAEQMRNTSGKDSLHHAGDFVREQGGSQALLDAYVAWHAAKGYWPGESPFGGLKES